jgi:hypothetical protein
LLLVMFAAAMWWVYRTAERVVAPRHEGTPAPAAAQKP